MTDRDETFLRCRDHLLALLDEWEADFTEVRQHKDEEITRLKTGMSDLVDQLETERALVKSLHADTKELRCLNASLRARDEVIAKLEVSVTRYAETVIKLKQDSDARERRYAALDAAVVDPDATSAELHVLTRDTEPSGRWVQALDELVNR